MLIKKKQDVIIVRLVRGEELIASLRKLADDESLDGGFFHGLGGAESASIGIYMLDTDKEYHFKDYEGPLEIISLNGNIAKDEQGELTVHCHATFSGPDLVVFGGHLKQAIVAGTCEIFIDLRTGGLKRVYDNEIGLKLLDLNG